MAMSGTIRINRPDSSTMPINDAYVEVRWNASYVPPVSGSTVHRYYLIVSSYLVHTNGVSSGQTTVTRLINNSGAAQASSTYNCPGEYSPGEIQLSVDSIYLTLTKDDESDYIYHPPEDLSLTFSTTNFVFTSSQYPTIYISTNFSGTNIPISIDSINIAPVALTATASGITTNSATVSCTCMQGDVPTTATNWYYKVDGGSSMSISGSGSSKTVTVGGFQQNSSHTVQFFANVGSTLLSSNVCSFTTSEATAPTITVSLLNRGDNSFTISATSSELSASWQYKILSTDPWTNFTNSTSGTSATQQVSGLTYGSTYSIQVRATGMLSTKTGTSSAVSFTANKPTTFTSSSISASYTSPMTITIGVSVSMVHTNTHTLSISANNESKIIASNLTLTNGNNAIQISADILSWIGTFLTNQSSAQFGLSLITYNSNGGVVGTYQSATLTVSVPDSEAPSFSNFLYEAQGGTALSGNNQYLVQGYSAIHIDASSASAHAGSTLVSYSVTYGGENLGSYTSSNITTPIVTITGTNALAVTVTDSFGRSTTVTKQVTSMPYSKIQLAPIASGDVKRDTNNDNVVKITVQGAYASSKIGNTEKNALTEFYYQYMTTDSTTWSSSVAITPVLTGTNFKIEELSITLPNADSSYYIRFTASDKLTSDMVVATIATSVPLVSFRKGMVGINNKNPNSALDVLGEIEMNGFNVQGFVRVVSNEDLDGLLETGIYVAEQDASYSSHHYPTNSRGIIEILPESQGLVQRFTKVPTDGKMWIRHYNTSTTSFGTWSQISGSGSFTQVQSNWNEEDTTDPSYIQNKPIIPPGVVVDDTLTPNGTNPVEGGAIYSAVESKAPKASGIYYVAGSGSTAGSSTSGSRRSARWRGTNSDITSYFSGLTVNFKIDVAGMATYGTVLDINTLGEHPVLRNVSTMIGTAYAVGCIVTLTYDADATGTVYTNNTSATITGAWKVADYDSNSNTVPSAYCTTAAGTAAKTATCTNYVLKANTYLHVLIQNSNTSASALTLSTNSTTAKPIYINGVASSSTNYTLPAGTYIAYYDGTAYQFRTDGVLPGKILAASAADTVPWTGIQNRPTLSHVSIDTTDSEQLNIIDI